MLSDIIVEFISSWFQVFTDTDFCTFQFLSVFNDILSFFVGNKSCNIMPLGFPYAVLGFFPSL